VRISTDFLERPMAPLPERWIRVRDHLVDVASTFLFVPLLQTTIGGLHAPAPWGVADSARWPVLVTWVMGWIVFPFAMGAWGRHWWWPPLCLGTVLATTWAWNGGQALIGPSPAYPDWQGAEPAVAVAMMPQALALGGLAAVMAAIGVALAVPVRRLDPRVLRWTSAIALLIANVAIIVAWVVGMAGPALGDTLLLPMVSVVTLLAATPVVAFKAGQWSGQWWCVLVCVIGPFALWQRWAISYLDALPPRSPFSHGYLLFVFLILGLHMVVAGVAAWVGVSMVRHRDPVGDR
jgi:hypothetical protein